MDYINKPIENVAVTIALSNSIIGGKFKVYSIVNNRMILEGTYDYLFYALEQANRLIVDILQKMGKDEEKS